MTNNWRHINKNKLKSLAPCDDRWKNYLKHYEEFSGDIVEFLELENISPEDKIWIFVRVAPRLLVEVFAIDCAFSAANTAAAYAAVPATTAAAYAHYAADYASDYANSAADYAAFSAANTAAAYAAYAAADAAAAAAHSADSAYYAANDAVRKQERENQVDAMIMIVKGE